MEPTATTYLPRSQVFDDGKKMVIVLDMHVMGLMELWVRVDKTKMEVVIEGEHQITLPPLGSMGSQRQTRRFTSRFRIRPDADLTFQLPMAEFLTLQNKLYVTVFSKEPSDILTIPVRRI